MPDTNLFMAAYWNRHSASAALLELARQGQVRLVISPALEREINATLARVRPRPTYLQGVQELLAGALRVEPGVAVRVVREDPEDDKLLACAAAGQADYLATNDRHLLRLEQFEGTAILTPTAVLRCLQAGLFTAAGRQAGLGSEDEGETPAQEPAP